MKNEKKYLYTIYFTIIMGLLAHGFMMLNKLPNHDDVDGLKSSWNAFELGRWGQSVLNQLSRTLFGSSVSVPWLIGIIAILMLSIAAIIFIRHFDINNMYLCFAVGGILVTFPAMTSTFTYVYILAPFCIAICLAFLGSIVVIRTPNLKGAMLGVVLLIASLSMYQTYIGIAAAVFVLQMVRDVIEEEIDLKKFFKKGFFYVTVLLVSMLGYVAITRGLIKITGWPLKDYQNLRSMGEISILHTIKGIAKIYLSVPLMITSNLYGLTGTLMSRIVTLVVFLLNLIFIFSFLKKCIKEKNWLRAICFGVLVFIYPVAYNLVYLMGDVALHTVMMYPTVMLFLECIYFVNVLLKENDISIHNWKDSVDKRQKTVQIYGIILLFCMAQLLFSYIHTANVTYLKMDLVQKESISYMTTVITQIKQMEGYRTDLKLSFVKKANDPVLTDLDGETQFSYTGLVGTNNARGLATMRRYELFLKYYCGFNQPCINIKDTGIDKEIIDVMPKYPEKGSIQIMKDVIVVKFDDMDED